MATSINDSFKKSSLQIADLPTGGSIGTAATTVDRFSVFIVNQTTAGQTITIPAPTDTSLSDVQEVVNSGTTMFILNGKQVNPGTSVQNVWTGTTYITDNSGFIPAVATTNTLTTTVNVATSTVNGVTSTAPIINSNTLTGTGSSITSTVNGVVSTLTPGTGTVQSTLGFNATGNLVKQTISFDSTVDFSVNANPNTVGTTFNPNTPSSTTVLYISTIDGSQWTYNGTNYIAEPVSSDWKTLGNAGTNPTTNFIGTTDAQRLTIRTNNTEKATILPNGNVGIGTSAPNAQLHVETGTATNTTNMLVGNTSINGNYGTTYRSATGGGAYFGYLGTAPNSGVTGAGIIAGSGKGISFYTDGNSLNPSDAANLPRLNITQTGLVGINETSPLNTLHIGTPSVANTAGVRLPINSGSANQTGEPIGVNASGDIVKIANNINTKWDLLGNIGTVQATNFIGTTDNIGLSFRTNNIIRQTISSAGNVGIGTNNPLSTLDINGSIGTGYTETTLAAYTATANDHTIRLTNGSLQTLTLPGATGVNRREYRVVNTTGFIKAFAASVTGLNGSPTTVIPASSSITVKSIGGAWVIVEQGSITSSFPTTLTTTTTTGTINATNTTYMQLTGVPAGTYDVQYRMTFANADTNNRMWATGITFNNNPITFPTGADSVATILGSLAANHPYTVSGYNRVTLAATGTIEVKGQIYGTQVTAPPFVGTNRLTAMRVA